EPVKNATFERRARRARREILRHFFSAASAVSALNVICSQRLKPDTTPRHSTHSMVAPALNFRIVEHFGAGAATPLWNHRSAQPRQRIVHPFARLGLAHYEESTRADP